MDSFSDSYLTDMPWRYCSEAQNLNPARYKGYIAEGNYVLHNPENADESRNLDDLANVFL